MDVQNDRGASGPAAEGASVRRRRLERLTRYTGVNIVSVTVDYAVFLALTQATGHPTTSSVAAYGLALILNYGLSRQFVFGREGFHKGERRLFTEFVLTGLLGLVLTALVTWLGVHAVGLKPLVAKTAAVLVCFIALYAIRSRLVFQRIE